MRKVFSEFVKNIFNNFNIGKRKIKVFSIVEDYAKIQESKLNSYKGMAFKSPVGENIKSFITSLKQEKNFIHKNLRKFISGIDINFLAELLEEDSEDFLRLKKLILDVSNNIDIILIEYDKTISILNEKYMNAVFLKNVVNLDKVEVKKIRNNIREEIQLLKTNIDEKFNYNFQKEVNELVLYFKSRKFAENRIEKIIELTNSASKEFTVGVKEITVPVFYTNISLVIVRFLSEEFGLVNEISKMTDYEKETVNFLISIAVVLISFYGSAFLRMYQNNLAKYKDNFYLLIKDYLKTYTSIFILGFSIGGSSFGVIDTYFQSDDVEMNSLISVFTANSLASIILLLANSPIMMASRSIKKMISKS